MIADALLAAAAVLLVATLAAALADVTGLWIDRRDARAAREAARRRLRRQAWDEIRRLD